MGNRGVQEAINTLVQAHTGTDDTLFFFTAVVNSVDIDNRICNCTSVEGAKNSFPNCRLMTELDDGILIIPTVGSNVSIILSTFTQPLVVGYSEVDKIILRGGDLGGLVRVKDLITKLNNLEDAYNGLKDKVNDLINLFNTHTHPIIVSSGTGSSTATTPTETPDTTTLTKTVRSDIENTAITQG